MADFTIRDEKGISFLNLQNTYNQAINKVKIEYWVDGISNSKTVDVIKQLDAGKIASFDLLKVPVEVTAIQIHYTISGQSIDTAIFKVDPTVFPNSYIRDFFYILSDQDEIDFYGGGISVLAGGTFNYLSQEVYNSIKATSVRFSDLNISHPVKFKKATKKLAKLQPLQVLSKNNTAFLDIRNQRDLAAIPAIKNLTLNHLDQITGTVKSISLASGVWHRQMARIDFNKKFYTDTLWLSWEIGTAKIETVKAKDVLGIVWGDGKIDFDGESGGFWYTKNWLSAGS